MTLYQLESICHTHFICKKVEKGFKLPCQSKSTSGTSGTSVWMHASVIFSKHAGVPNWMFNKVIITVTSVTMS